jgi:hypothetical protein
MYLTLDILSDNDPYFIQDNTHTWEIELDDDSSPKLKFPIKLKDDILKGETLEFKEPIIKEPIFKKKEIDNSPKVVTIGKKKTNKKNLF